MLNLNGLLKTKFLGVLISHKLSWKSHILTVCSKMSKNSDIIARIRHLLPTDQVLRLYHTLVEPYMSYCCIVWAGINKSGDLNRIHIIQKRYCRLISFSNSRASSAPLFKSLKILNVYDLFRYQASLYMFKRANGLLPRVLFGFKLNCDIHSVGTEAETQLPLKRSSRFQRLFPNPSWLVRGRASRYQKLAPTFPGIDSCLMVTKRDFLEMEASL